MRKTASAMPFRYECGICVSSPPQYHSAMNATYAEAASAIPFRYECAAYAETASAMPFRHECGICGSSPPPFRRHSRYDALRDKSVHAADGRQRASGKLPPPFSACTPRFPLCARMLSVPSCNRSIFRTCRYAFHPRCHCRPKRVPYRNRRKFYKRKGNPCSVTALPSTGQNASVIKRKRNHQQGKGHPRRPLPLFRKAKNICQKRTGHHSLSKGKPHKREQHPLETQGGKKLV